jgi:hypothetical protein
VMAGFLRNFTFAEDGTRAEDSVAEAAPARAPSAE